MVAGGGAQANRHVQAARVEAHFLANGSRAPRMADGDYTDAIIGVSIAVEPLFALADQALEHR